MKGFVSFMLLGLMTLFPLTHASAQFNFNEDKTIVSESFNRDFFVNLNGLRVRSTPDDAGKVMGILDLNDKVRIVGTDLINNKFIEVKVVKTEANLLPADKYFVVMEFLALKAQDFKTFTGKYFVVVNIATEKLRVYERQCMDNSCPHKMIMETDVVAGEDKDHPIAEKGKGRSILGSYRVTGWAKFYQDTEGHYPAWYNASYPMPPQIGNNSWRDWFKDRYMPIGPDGKPVGKMRGAFGWYTAFVEPNAFGQWTHGTLGWGEDKDKYIKKTKGVLINVVSDPRSSGCTRNNNEAIAFLRQLVETGTPIVKIYAREMLRDPSLSAYQGQAQREWRYIMTKNAGQRADRSEVMKALNVTDADVDNYWSAFRYGGAAMIDPASKLNQILEVGTYEVDNEPTVVEFKERKKILGKWRGKGQDGNVYGLKNEEMSSGVFYVDAGFLNGYNHPRAILEVGGFMDEVTPPWMNSYLLTR
jgi:hypothetical protein